MSWLTNLFTSGDKKVQRVFMSSMDHYASKDFHMAYNGFMKAYKMTKRKKIKLNCLINASACAESLQNKKEASELLLSAAQMRSSLQEPIKDIAETLDKAYHLIYKEGKLNDHAEIIAPLMIFKIANQDYPFANKLNKRLKEENANSPLSKFAMEIYHNLVLNPDIVWTKEKFIDFPSQLPGEFKNYLKDIQTVIRNSTAISIKIEDPERQSIKAGDEFEFVFALKNYTPLTIKKIFIKTGAKGSIKKSSTDKITFPLNVTESETVMHRVTLDSNLTGNWTIGPIIVEYMIGEKTFEYKSDFISINVEEGEKSVNLELSYEEIEEDFEYEVTGTINNNGKTTLENLKILMKVPSGCKIIEGTPEKTIFELHTDETFSFSNKVQFESGIFGKEYNIKLVAKYDEGGEIQKQITISG